MNAPHLRYSLRLLLCFMPMFAFSGCVSPLALNKAVGAYDEAITSAASKQLLMNIARAQRHQPLHFTGVSNVAATFDFNFNAGATPALGGLAGAVLMSIFGGSVSENPTISIVPIEGEEFTKRLLRTTRGQEEGLPPTLPTHHFSDSNLSQVAQSTC